MHKETKEERKRRFKSMKSSERHALIRELMKEKGLKEGSGVPNKTYDKNEVFELIRITSCFPELRNNKL